MVHELVIRISSEDKNGLENIKQAVKRNVHLDINDTMSTNIVSYSSNGLLEESDNHRGCFTRQKDSFELIN